MEVIRRRRKVKNQWWLSARSPPVKDERSHREKSCQRSCWLDRDNRTGPAPGQVLRTSWRRKEQSREQSQTAFEKCMRNAMKPLGGCRRFVWEIHMFEFCMRFPLN